MYSRAEHLAWAKERALAYLPDDPTSALASMLSDLGKHPDLEGHAALQVTAMLWAAGHLTTAAEVRTHITGFN